MAFSIVSVLFATSSLLVSLFSLLLVVVSSLFVFVVSLFVVVVLLFLFSSVFTYEFISFSELALALVLTLELNSVCVPINWDCLCVVVNIVGTPIAEPIARTKPLIIPIFKIYLISFVFSFL